MQNYARMKLESPQKVLADMRAGRRLTLGPGTWHFKPDPRILTEKEVRDRLAQLEAEHGINFAEQRKEIWKGRKFSAEEVAALEEVEDEVADRERETGWPSVNPMNDSSDSANC